MLWIGLCVTDYATVVLKSDDAFGLAGPELETKQYFPAMAA